MLALTERQALFLVRCPAPLGFGEPEASQFTAAVSARTRSTGLGLLAASAIAWAGLRGGWRWVCRRRGPNRTERRIEGRGLQICERRFSMGSPGDRTAPGPFAGPTASTRPRPPGREVADHLGKSNLSTPESRSRLRPGSPPAKSGIQTEIPPGDSRETRLHPRRPFTGPPQLGGMPALIPTFTWTATMGSFRTAASALQATTRIGGVSRCADAPRSRSARSNARSDRDSGSRRSGNRASRARRARPAAARSPTGSAPSARLGSPPAGPRGHLAQDVILSANARISESSATLARLPPNISTTSGACFMSWPTLATAALSPFCACSKRPRTFSRLAFSLSSCEDARPALGGPVFTTVPGLVALMVRRRLHSPPMVPMIAQ